MVGPAMDCLNNPLGAVRALFEKSCCQSASVLDSRSDWGVKELFDSYLYQQGGFGQVPEINMQQLSAMPHNSLVRFRGMVQDMLDVEYYLGAYKEGMTWRTTKFTDVTHLPILENSETQVWDRRLLYCVPAPGENGWVKEAFASSSLCHSASRSHVAVVSHSEKRCREPEDSKDVNMDVGCDNAPSEAKRLKEREEAVTENGGEKPQVLDLNMPLGDSSLLPCIVKVYDGVDSDIKLNDVIEFTGVLSFDPELSASSFTRCDATSESPHSPFMEEDVCSQLPASRVPRLHCVTYRKLSLHKILDSVPNTEGKSCILTATPAELRASILEGLTKVLCGDQLAAEYLLLHMLSQVHHRIDTMALGKFSLNIVTPNTLSVDSSSLAVAVAKAVEALLPCSHLMSLSLQNLNKSLMSPRKDYTANRLVTGSLQLAEGTYLMLDETALSTGQLTAIGIQNVQSLKDLMEWQKVEYDFQYYKLDMPTDVPVLVISNARSRLLPADVVIPIQSTSGVSSFSGEDLELKRWRLFLTSVRNMEHTLDSSVQKLVEDELVSARQHDRSLTPETFHRWLNLARLLSLSYGESTLSLERWQMVREMERRCAERIGHR